MIVCANIGMGFICFVFGFIVAARAAKKSTEEADKIIQEAIDDLKKTVDKAKDKQIR